MQAEAGINPFGHIEVPLLAADEIQLWQLRLNLANAATRRRDVDGVVHDLLSRHCGSDGVVIGRDAHGKPHLRGAGDLGFNLSHCGGDLVIALARGQALGVDIESLQRRPASLHLAQRFFTPSEADALAALTEARRAEAFLRLWTHKEAVLKATGMGLSFGLARLEFSLDAAGKVICLQSIDAEAGAVEDWRLHAWEPRPGLVGCLAWQGPPRSVRQFTVPV
ncbi:MAG: 4'-phosphopantetheinyl transferase superfamily protein [Dokdonella sp.]|uniref:4'-phosphopantetheinyl transferase family protein n=1 Tax=Dokdonella sp. TaxID=2291710 RepID=UPI0025B94E3E|nr:4'-phosphopantetheinyl transferase superfamily protein [Dokdonella sp.]MBZ0221909.1 4'-phosphopantetheinyl transferase superfamily protein [Dokdonella sp.]MCC7256675.1 4'-phosphopantetheinyl transferase superfamily protein [Dokdonella sp.]